MRALREAEVRPADAADVEHRQRREAHRLRIEPPGRDVERRGREVALRREDSLRRARRARRIHLHDRVAGLAATAGVDGVGGREPRLVVGADADHVDLLRDGVGDVCGGAGERRPGDQERRARVGHDRRQLGRRQPPVERHRDRADLARRDEQLDDLGCAAVQVRDTRARARARREQQLSQPARPLVELRVGDRAVAVADRDRVGTLRCMPADDVRDSQLARGSSSPAGRRGPSKKRPIASSISGTSVT